MDFKEILNLLWQIVSENYILILVAGNALALIIAIIAIVKASKSKKNCVKEDLPSEFSLGTVNVKVELADVNLEHADIKNPENGSLNDKEDFSNDEVCPETPGLAEAEENPEPLVIEKLIPVKMKSSVDDEKNCDRKEFCTGKSGRVYSEEELKNQIKD